MATATPKQTGLTGRPTHLSNILMVLSPGIPFSIRRSLVHSFTSETRGRNCRCSSTGPKTTTSQPTQPLIQPAKFWGRGKGPGSQPTTSTFRSPAQQSKQNSDGGDEDPNDEESTWGIFNPSRYSGRWDIPWGPGRVAGGMALWFGSFVGVGFILVPQLYRLAGVSIFDLSPEDKATFTLVCQAVETVVSLGLIRALTAGPISQSGAGSAADLDLFVYDVRQPFRAPRGWAFWGLVGMLAAPAVVGSTAALLSAVGYESAVGGQGTVDGVAGMIDLDLPTYLSLLAVTGVMAPLLEETVFRGFLLTSLTRFMPTWAAVVASSVSFGIAHLSARDLPVLVALGLLLGWSYVRSRNLLTPMLIHGAWNSGVLTLLFWLASEGVDVQRLITEMRDATGS